MVKIKGELDNNFPHDRLRGDGETILGIRVERHGKVGTLKISQGSYINLLSQKGKFLMQGANSNSDTHIKVKTHRKGHSDPHNKGETQYTIGKLKCHQGYFNASQHNPILVQFHMQDVNTISTPLNKTVKLTILTKSIKVSMIDTPFAKVIGSWYLTWFGICNPIPESIHNIIHS